MSTMTLQELAVELDRQREAKKDFIADTTELRAIPDDSGMQLQVGDLGAMPIRQHAHRQIGERLGIPAKFYDRLNAKHQDLLAWNINTLFKREPESRMIRTLDNKVRAFLSERYRPLDNYDFAQAVLSRLTKLKGDILRCDLTETKLYIKVVVPGIEREIKKPGTFMGDGGHNPIHVLKPGAVCGNSEVGSGSVFFQPGIHEVNCSNLAVFNRNAMRKHHIGGKQSNQLDEQLFAVLKDETRAVADKAFWMQVQDLVEASLEGELFEQHVAECEAALNGTPIERPIKAVRQLENLSETEQDGILAGLVHGGDLSQFGLQFAVTEFAQTVDDADRRLDLERFGGSVIELPQQEWQRLACAA